MKYEYCIWDDGNEKEGGAFIPETEEEARFLKEEDLEGILQALLNDLKTIKDERKAQP